MENAPMSTAVPNFTSFILITGAGCFLLSDSSNNLSNFEVSTDGPVWATFETICWGSLVAIRKSSGEVVIKSPPGPITPSSIPTLLPNPPSAALPAELSKSTLPNESLNGFINPNKSWV